MEIDQNVSIKSSLNSITNHQVISIYKLEVQLLIFDLDIEH